MWVILRILFAVLMYGAFKEARFNAQVNPMHGDISNAFWVAVVVFLAMANGIVWAPYFAEKVSDPLTGGTINAEYKGDTGILLRAIRWFEKRHASAAVRWLCFMEGCRRPWLPTAFAIGLNHTAPGSWLEKVYATEVFKFNNAQNCLKAYQALKGHGIDPRPHHNPGVNLVLMSHDQEIKDTPATVEVPAAPPPPPIERNKRIKLGM